MYNLNMRYIGNKTKLLIHIEKAFQDVSGKKKNLKILDAFSGSGAVSSHFSNENIIFSNDILYFSKCIAVYKINRNESEIRKHLKEIRNLKPLVGYVTKSFSPYKESKRMYFSVANAKKIDSAWNGCASF